MLLLAIVAFIATRMFYRAAAGSGYHIGKAASAPVIGLMVVLAANHVVVSALLAVFVRINVGESVASRIVWLNGLFVVGAYLVFLRKNYEAITR